MNGKVLPLGFVQSGQRAIIKEFTGGRSLSRRLRWLRVIWNVCGSPLIVSIGEGRLAIGCGMALKIMVEEVSEK
jgi:ferrous iron transport protein A